MFWTRYCLIMITIFVSSSTCYACWKKSCYEPLAYEPIAYEQVVQSSQYDNVIININGLQFRYQEVMCILESIEKLSQADSNACVQFVQFCHRKSFNKQEWDAVKPLLNKHELLGKNEAAQLDIRTIVKALTEISARDQDTTVYILTFEEAIMKSKIEIIKV
jgi:hypothetical protein